MCVSWRGEPPALYFDLRTRLCLHLCAYLQKCMRVYHQKCTVNLPRAFDVCCVCACKGRHARVCPILDVTLSTRRNLNNGCIQMSTLIRHISPKCSRLTHRCNAARASSIVFKNNSILAWCTFTSLQQLLFRGSNGIGGCAMCVCAFLVKPEKPD